MAPDDDQPQGIQGQALTRSGSPRSVREDTALDRRKHRRFYAGGAAVSVPATLLRFLRWRFWRSRRAHPCGVHNVSKGGLAFDYDRPVKRHLKLRLQVSLPGRSDPLLLTGSTRWCRRVEPHIFRVGIRFDPFDDGTTFDPHEWSQAISQLPPAP